MRATPTTVTSGQRWAGGLDGLRQVLPMCRSSWGPIAATGTGPRQGAEDRMQEVGGQGATFP